MADESLDPMAQYQEPEVVTEDNVGNLPSAKEESSIAMENFQFNDEMVAKYFKNGKLQGRFDNIEGVLNTLKSVEDKYANVMREQKTQSTPQVDMNEVAQPLIDRFVDNGMELTDDILEEAKEKGIDIRDVKLAAIDIKERVGKAYEIVGGKENYDAMLEWGKENLPDSKKEEFDKGLKSNMSEYAIKGLYSDYKASLSDTQPVVKDRLSGDSSNTQSNRGYSSQAEILKDKAYLNSMQGRNDRGAKLAHEARLARTPDEIIYGR